MNRSALSRALRVTLLALGAATAMGAHALEAGQPAPELGLQGATLADMKGKVVLVDFWASWCGPCKQSFPFMNELQAKYKSQGLEVVGVNVDAKRDDADKFLAEVPARFTVAFDAKGESARRFEVKSMPSSLIVGRDGKVVASHRGFKAEDREEIERRIVAALASR